MFRKTGLSRRSLLAVCSSALLGCVTPDATEGLYPICVDLRSKRFLDLTHSFEHGIPRWPGFPDARRETIYWYEEGVGTHRAAGQLESSTRIGGDGYR